MMTLLGTVTSLVSLDDRETNLSPLTARGIDTRPRPISTPSPSVALAGTETTSAFAASRSNGLLVPTWNRVSSARKTTFETVVAINTAPVHTPLVNVATLVRAFVEAPQLAFSFTLFGTGLVETL